MTLRRMAPVLEPCSEDVDWLNTQVGKYVIWLILASTLVSGINAVVRKAFNTSSNAFLEVQWYLFAASFLLAAGYTLLQPRARQGRRDQRRLSKRAQIWIDIFGFVFSHAGVRGRAVVQHPLLLQGYSSGEMSSNAGGLIRWPVYLMMPLGFGLLLLQGWSELIKRIAFLRA
jgi:TRAP-type mannitol/chloroaromatic compound transport system permease small subunit